ncbi:MAG: hypothetical protein RQ752_13385 [Thermohalobaculum sp.]|nr:hypothetical protein [Thermohalobaculum sp.]
MFIFVFWLIFAVLVGVFAARNGRSGILAFFVAVILSPLIAFIIYLVIGRSEAGERARIEREERMRAEIRRQIADGRGEG